MSRSIDVPLPRLRFPATCVVCMSPASRSYGLQRIFTFGRRSYTVNANVPMCEQHVQAASFKGTAEKRIGAVGVILGVLLGIAATVILLLHWQRTEQGNIAMNLLISGIVGLGIFLIVWALISLSIAPLFADRPSREARKAVRITHYWPGNQVVRLKFENEQLAEIVQEAST